MKIKFIVFTMLLSSLFVVGSVEAGNLPTKQAKKSTKMDINFKLKRAAMNGNTEEMQQHLDKGANINSVDPDNNTPLLWSMYRGHIDGAKWLINYGANVNAVNTINHTPFTIAIRNNQIELVQIMLDAGADLTTTIRGYTPLQLAETYNRPEIVELINAHIREHELDRSNSPRSRSNSPRSPRNF